MKITAIETIPLRLPVKRSLTVAGGTYTELTHVLLKVHTDDGITGLGEVESAPSYDRIGVEPPEGIVAVLNHLRPTLIGEDPFNVEGIWTKMDTAVKGHLWVKAGIDITLYDIMGKAIGRPAYYLLGGCLRREHPVEGVGYGISMDEPKKVAELAKWAVQRGFTQLELKAGDRDPRLDLERLRLVREAVGDEPEIKIDFNRGYNASTAITIIREMEKYSIQWVEQPVEHWDLDGLARIRASINTPLIVDESVNTPQEMVAVVKREAADAVHIKPTIKGGLTGAKRIYAIAEAAGLFIIPGTLTPSGVGMGAVHAFVASARHVHRGIHGSPLDMLAEDIVKDPIPEGSATIRISDKPGLGVELDDRQVEKFRVK